ncbi:hypothetical protein [Sphingomonas pituitosa]|uniref:hypothetical protein n=1 Tax=Sphingomonas pituitosa TaxID=99597 RepID=UPI000A74D7F9|nr:hypothetical protein [Sphingomonas pituitosa]
MPAPGFRRRSLTALGPRSRARPLPGGANQGPNPMTDILWLAALGGLFLLTLAFVQLCVKA